jgi:ubiquinone/menaquinone biosynthesis C-methylase UbiE
MVFKDHFSQVAATYSAYRPNYPSMLFEYVARVAPGHDLVWDCATGNGQAATGLANHFAKVIATDASASQIAQAIPHARVEYRVAPAEASGLDDHSADLVTVAQALHWFDLHQFYPEVRRVLKPGGAIVVWAYLDCYIDDVRVNTLIQRLNKEIVGPYWPPERRLIDEEYRTLPFPFREIETPGFTLEHAWSMAELCGYLRSWSATSRYMAAHGRDPVAAVEPALADAWGDVTRPRVVRWPGAMRAGYVE